MPELPDVEHMRRYFESEALGVPLVGVEVRDPLLLRGLEPSALDGALVGAGFASTYRHGKYLFASTAEGDRPWLLLHFGMTGGLERTQLGEVDPRYTRVSFRFADGGALHLRDQRRLGRVGLVDDPAGFVAGKRLGPDALDPALTAPAFDERLAQRRGFLKGVLTNQQFVAGLGNIYADEVCLAAGLAPFSLVEHLSKDDRRELHKTMRRVLGKAIDLLEAGRDFPRSWLLTQRRADGDCRGCGGKVARRRFEGRYTYWCPRCQKEV
jgi:formamidopyrimidine-DNA glycosylase